MSIWSASIEATTFNSLINLKLHEINDFIHQLNKSNNKIETDNLTSIEAYKDFSSETMEWFLHRLSIEILILFDHVHAKKNECLGCRYPFYTSLNENDSCQVNGTRLIKCTVEKFDIWKIKFKMFIHSISEFLLSNTIAISIPYELVINMVEYVYGTNYFTALIPYFQQIMDLSHDVNLFHPLIKQWDKLFPIKIIHHSNNDDDSSVTNTTKTNTKYEIVRAKRTLEPLFKFRTENIYDYLII